MDKQHQGAGDKAQGQPQERQTRKTNEGLAAAFGGISILSAILGTAILFFTSQVRLPSPILLESVR